MAKVRFEGKRLYVDDRELTSGDGTSAHLETIACAALSPDGYQVMSVDAVMDCHLWVYSFGQQWSKRTSWRLCMGSPPSAVGISDWRSGGITMMVVRSRTVVRYACMQGRFNPFMIDEFQLEEAGRVTGITYDPLLHRVMLHYPDRSETFENKWRKI